MDNLSQPSHPSLTMVKIALFRFNTALFSSVLLTEDPLCSLLTSIDKKSEPNIVFRLYPRVTFQRQLCTYSVFIPGAVVVLYCVKKQITKKNQKPTNPSVKCCQVEMISTIEPYMIVIFPLLGAIYVISD